MSDQDWKPVFIDVESEFDKFVGGFRHGQRVTDLIDKIPKGHLNADYYFSSDDIIIELKCIEGDSTDDASYAERLIRAYTHYGYTGSDIMGYLFRGEPMPDRVQRRLASIIRRPIVQALKKANKQIRATKELLGRPNASGLAIVANNNNHGFSPAQFMSIISRAALRLSDNHLDGIVYTTPNVFHDAGDRIARQYWVPVYKEGRECLADRFVNDLGQAWLDNLEVLQGPSLDRIKSDEMPEEHWHSRPAKELKEN